MKRLTTVILAVAFMIAGVAAAFMNFSPPGNKTMTAATMPAPLQWNTNGRLPLDLQLDLDKRLSHEAPTVEKDTVKDTIYIETIKWKTRYKKNAAARTAAREVGKHLTAVTPDSMPLVPTIISTLDREEQPSESVVDSKSTAVQLRIDGVIVYDSENEIHSTGESQ